jgi:23S rRNA (adenine2503-C2)-methyltransferase
MSQTPVYFLDRDLHALEEDFAALGANPTAAKRLYTAVVRGGLSDFSAMDGRLARPLIAWLKTKEDYSLHPIRSHRVMPSQDGSCKYLLSMAGGGEVECVAMPFDGRITYCLSSQVGCAMGCTFCATAALGFTRQLSAAEITAQLLLMRSIHQPPGERTLRTNIAFMGMGEALHNLEQVLLACRHFCHADGLALSERDLAISTCGLTPKLGELARAVVRPQLMVSIGSPIEEERSRLMPINRAYPLHELGGCLTHYPLRKGERIMLSQVLLAGVNDSQRHAAALARFASNFPSLVNLIPFNAHSAAGDMQAPSECQIASYARPLLEAGVFVTIRRSRGGDVAAACGQLAGHWDSQEVWQ